MPEQKVYVIDLIKESVDLNSSDAHPKAHFLIKADGTNKLFIKCTHSRKVYINYRAIIDNNINMIEKRLYAKITKCGKFCFEIPQYTIGLEIEVKIHNSCKSHIKLKIYCPEPCEPDFSSNLLTTRQMIKHCNQMAIDTTGLDHAPVTIGENRTFGHQIGPGKSSRAMAIIHIAMFEALNSIIGGYVSYLNIPRGPAGASVDAAIAQAAHDSTIWLFPSHAPRLDALLTTQLSQIPNGIAKSQGILVGTVVAQNIIANRTNDGSEIPEPIIGIDYIINNVPGEWSMDPISQIPKAIGAFWDQVKTFVIPTANTYRCPPPPKLDSVEYMMAYDEVKALGGDGITTPTVRSAEQIFIGNFWAYDGTPSLCAPPRLYNQVAMQVANDQGLDTVQMMRMLAILNVAMADSCIACWESKYFYKFWRPVTAIRGGATDGNVGTIGDVNWTPIGAPASNVSNGVNFTPPFCSYPSGHSSMMPALAQILRNTFGRDNIKFTFVSDEYDGKTIDNEGFVRPLIPRTFDTISQAEDENGDSRIYLGIHFKFDKTAGITLGRDVGDYVYAHLYQPV